LLLGVKALPTQLFYILRIRLQNTEYIEGVVS